MAAPTFESVTKAATASSPTVSHYVKAYSLWAKIGPLEGAKVMGLNQLGFIKYAQLGAELHLRAFQRSMNV